MNQNIERHQMNKSQSVDYIRLLSQIAFILLIFFSIFTTSMPFYERHQDLDKVTSSNMTTQIIYTTIFLLTLISILFRLDKLYQYIKQDYFLWLFIVWALLSVFWSDYPLVSFKRWFQIFTVVLCFITYFSQNDFRDIKIVKTIFYVYLAISIISVFTIPGAIDRVFGTWRGLAPHKNTLGEISLICFVATIFFSASASNHREKIIAFVFSIISAALLFGTQSSTAIISFAIIIIIYFLISINNFFKPLNIGNSVMYFLFFLGLIFMLALLSLGKETLQIIPELFNKDLTFSGRVDLWQNIFYEIKKHPITGCGFDGFWVIDPNNAILLELYEEFIWLPNQSHNGYLDLLNEVGMIGILLFFSILVHFFSMVFQTKESNHYRYFFVIAYLIINLTETTFFRLSHFSFTMFAFAYIQQVFISKDLNQDIKTHRL